MKYDQLHTQSYYRLDNFADGCNVEDFSRRLIVNCSGVCAVDIPFKTNVVHGRRDYYLMYVISGELDASSGDQCFLLKEGDVACYTPNANYAYQSRLNQRMIYLWIHFTGSEASRLLAERGLKTGCGYSIGRSREIENDFESIQRLFITRPAFYLEEAAAILELILTRVGRTVCVGQTVHPSERFKTSLNHLNRHYAEPLHLDALAAMEYLSVSRYSSLFRQITGLSPQQYLIELRLKNARDMLLNTNLSVTEAARSVGYDDALYFSRLFHRHFGVSPSSLRRKQK